MVKILFHVDSAWFICTFCWRSKQYLTLEHPDPLIDPHIFCRLEVYYTTSVRKRGEHVLTTHSLPFYFSLVFASILLSS